LNKIKDLEKTINIKKMDKEIKEQNIEKFKEDIEEITYDISNRMNRDIQTRIISIIHWMGSEIMPEYLDYMKDEIKKIQKEYNIDEETKNKIIEKDFPYLQDLKEYLQGRFDDAGTENIIDELREYQFMEY
jgi:hypothetical protein